MQFGKLHQSSSVLCFRDFETRLRRNTQSCRYGRSKPRLPESRPHRLLLGTCPSGASIAGTKNRLLLAGSLGVDPARVLRMKCTSRKRPCRECCGISLDTSPARIDACNNTDRNFIKGSAYFEMG